MKFHPVDTRYLTYPLTLIFFLSAFILFNHPIKIGDFWWHLNTGRWIWENASLPDVNPFTYTETPQFAAKTSVVMKGYWLSQVYYYLTYRIAGFRGIVLMNAALFTAIVFVLWRITKLHGLSGAPALALISPCALLAVFYDEVRPQGFTFLFVLLTVYIMERGLKQLREGRRPLRYQRPVVLLILLNLLWANMHLGFPLSYLILAAYASGELIAWSLKRQQVFPREVITWSGAAVGASLINPSHIKTVFFSIREVTTSWPEYRDIIELNPPWRYIQITQGEDLYLWLLGLSLTLPLFILCASHRRITPSHALLLAGLAVPGALAFRFTLLFVFAAVGVAGIYGAQLRWSARRLTHFAAAVIALLVCASMLYAAHKREHPAGADYYYATLPVQAASFIERERPAAPLLNSFSWGGYLGWRLFPHYRVFVESRLMDPTAYGKLNEAQRSGSEGLLDEYGINTVLYRPADPVTGELEGIVLDMLAYDTWQLVYFDLQATVFVRRGTTMHLPVRSKREVFDYLLSLNMMNMQRHRGSPQPYFQLADIYQAMGDMVRAEEAYRMGMKLQH